MSTRKFVKRRTERNPRRPTLCTLLTSAALLLPAASAAADSFPVTTTADSGEGSLRAAIEAANGQIGPDSIPIGASGTIDLQSALPVVSDAAEIAGPGQDALAVRRGAVGNFRIFETGLAAVSLSGMTIADGRSDKGAGVLSQGPLTLTGVTVTGNEAVASGETETIAIGGGVLSLGPLTMRETTVSGNIAAASEGGLQTQAEAGGVGALGGALIERSTVSGNSAVATGAGVTEFALAEGAGILFSGGKLNRVQRSTISGNSATASGGNSATTAFGAGIEGEAPTISGSTIAANLANPASLGGANLDVTEETVVRDTIVSDPRGGGPSCGQALISEGFNIDDGSSCGLAEQTDLAGVDPGLDPSLAANGGPTPTHALLPGSAAIDAGSAFGTATDQRGLPRPSEFATIADPLGGDGSDIGAFELQAPAGVGGPASEIQASAADTVAPDTQIDREPPVRTHKRFARFRFSSTEPGARFECALDGRPFRGCETPMTRRVKRGAKHVFAVRAIDSAGNADPTPAKCFWRVKRPHPPAGGGR